MVRVPYIVNIFKNGITHCAGTILSPIMIITAAHCVEDTAMYHILSGSSCVNLGKHHNITRKIFHPSGYHPSRYSDDIALLIVHPFIDIVHSIKREIIIHTGPIPDNTYGILSGWGSSSEPP